MGTEKMEEEGKNNNKHLDVFLYIYIQYTWPSTRRIQSLKTLAQIETEISVIAEFFVREKKWTNKGNDKH